jgi:hypothetical protein
MVYKKDYNEVSVDTDKQQSRINAAGLINSTLENLWNGCYTAMATGSLVIWNRKLDAIWCILGGDCQEGDETDKEMAKLNLQIYETGTLNHKKEGFAKPDETESVKMALQYLLLNKKSLFLRRLQNKQGKGTAYVSDEDDDFD